VAHSAPPALHADNRVALAQDTELDGVHDTPLKTAVDILLPGRLLEVRLLLGEVEGVYTAVQVGVLSTLAKDRVAEKRNLHGRPGRYARP
jgi:hypothetical protein